MLRICPYQGSFHPINPTCPTTFNALMKNGESYNIDNPNKYNKACQKINWQVVKPILHLEFFNLLLITVQAVPLI